PINMADRNKSLPANMPGDFFVDSTCINCDTCRQLAPATFGEGDDFAFVQNQPANTDQRRLAIRALLACPTGSIGTADRSGTRDVLGDFPMLLAPGVFYCGFNSPK